MYAVRFESVALLMLSEILKGRQCPYCSGATKLVPRSTLYPNHEGLVYLCSPCSAWVGVKKGSDKSLGFVANSNLRKWRRAAHQWFDPLWKGKPNGTRDKAYKWLAEQLDIPEEECHIAMFDIPQCKRLIGLCRLYYPI